MTTEGPWPAWIRLGTLLLREGLVTPEQLELALAEQVRVGRRLGEILVGWGWVSGRTIARALARQYEIDFLDLAESELEEEAVALLPEELACRYRAVPVRFLADRLLLVASADPTDVSARNGLRSALGSRIRLAVVDEADLERLLTRAYRDARL